MIDPRRNQMPNPERIFFLGRWHPGVGSRVIGIPDSETYGGRRGLLIARHRRFQAFVQVCWDDDPSNIESDVNLVLITDEPVLDQMARIYDGS
jgi:hypothetical protein